MNEKYLEMAVKKTPMITLGRYRPEIGKYKGRRLDEIPLLHLKKYHGDLCRVCRNKAPTPKMVELRETIRQFLAIDEVKREIERIEKIWRDSSE